MTNIAIIGMGISGAQVLKSIIDHDNFNEDIKIHIFEKRDELGVGIAYEDDVDIKLLNEAERYMSLDVSNQDDIFDWIDENLSEDYQKEGMMTRTDYGDYIKDRFEKHFSNPHITIHKDKIVGIEKIDDSYKLTGEEETYDEVFDTLFLTIGQSYYRDAYNLSGFDNFIKNTYPLREKLSAIGDNKSIGVIGTGPTSIDIYRYIKSNIKFSKPLYFFTKSQGFGPVEIKYDGSYDICSIDNEWIDEHLDDDGFISLEDFIITFNEDSKKAERSLEEVYEEYKAIDLEQSAEAIEKNDQSLAFYQLYGMELWYVIARLYNSFSGQDRYMFDQSYLNMLNFLISKTPNLTTKMLIADKKAGNFEIILQTEKVSVENDKFIVETAEDKTYEVDVLINAQGFEKNLVQATDKDMLIKSLFDQNLIEPDRGTDFIRLTYPTYHPLSKKYGVVDNIYLGGMWAGGTDIYNNDMRSILQASTLIANDFMKKFDK